MADLIHEKSIDIETDSFDFSTLMLHQYNDTDISQVGVEGAGYVNLTQMAKATGKRIDNWLRLESTSDLLKAFNSKENLNTSDLRYLDFPALVTQRGRHDGGTWAHPDIAIQFAQWCSPKFALQVSRWVREWIIGSMSSLKITGKANLVKFTDIADEITIRGGGIATVSDQGVAQITGVSPAELLKHLHPHRTIGFEDGYFNGSQLTETLLRKGFDANDFSNWREQGVCDQALAVIIGYYAYRAGERCTGQARYACDQFMAVGIRAMCYVAKGLSFSDPDTSTVLEPASSTLTPVFAIAPARLSVSSSSDTSYDEILRMADFLAKGSAGEEYAYKHVEAVLKVERPALWAEYQKMRKQIEVVKKRKDAAYRLNAEQWLEIIADKLPKQAYFKEYFEMYLVWCRSEGEKPVPKKTFEICLVGAGAERVNGYKKYETRSSGEVFRFPVVETPTDRLLLTKYRFKLEKILDHTMADWLRVAGVELPEEGYLKDYYQTFASWCYAQHTIPVSSRAFKEYFCRGGVQLYAKHKGSWIVTLPLVRDE